MMLQQYGRSAPRVAASVPMSVVIVGSSCASGIALVLILIAVVAAVRCRRIRSAHHRPSSSKRLPVDMDGDVTSSPRLGRSVNCSKCRQAKRHRQGRVMMNGIKPPSRSDQFSVRIPRLFYYPLTDYVDWHTAMSLVVCLSVCLSACLDVNITKRKPLYLDVGSSSKSVDFGFNCSKINITGSLSRRASASQQSAFSF